MGGHDGRRRVVEAGVDGGEVPDDVRHVERPPARTQGHLAQHLHLAATLQQRGEGLGHQTGKVEAELLANM